MIEIPILVCLVEVDSFRLPLLQRLDLKALSAKLVPEATM